MVFGTAEMRELIIITASTQAGKFNMYCAAMDSDTLVKTLDEHRLYAWTAFDVVKFMCRASNTPPPPTVYDYASFMMHGSPMIRGLVYELLIHIREMRPGKVLITEDVPILAWWWDLTLNLLGLKPVTFHSRLSTAERDTMIKNFKSQDKI